ncbi:MAG: ATP-dependent DNA helicase [Acidimicrobiales bacterium]|nr:ATP-dependent DNA helicase [Acidimicrobiales bacterium]
MEDDHFDEDSTEYFEDLDWETQNGNRESRSQSLTPEQRLIIEESVEATLGKVTSALPNGGESRAGQVQMAKKVGLAMASNKNLIVQAGTGTGKSLAYLIPCILSGKSVVVATATKALQDQLANKDIPQVGKSLGREIKVAVLKGRSNYICQQKVDEMNQTNVGDDTIDDYLEEADINSENEKLFESENFGIEIRQKTPKRKLKSPKKIPEVESNLGKIPNGNSDQVRRIVSWISNSTTGDLSELDFEPSPQVWHAMSATSDECPGPRKCPAGDRCFCEAAKERAKSADLVVVNLHLYGAHLSSGGVVLPPHDVLVIDEAHECEDILLKALGGELSASKIKTFARNLRPQITNNSAASALQGDPALDLSEAADLLENELRPFSGKRIKLPLPESLLGVINLLEARVENVMKSLRQVMEASQALSDFENVGSTKDAQIRARLLSMATNLVTLARRFQVATSDSVIWVSENKYSPILNISPIEVGPTLGGLLWNEVCGILTSATIPPQVRDRLGLSREETDELDVGSPFPYKENSILYCPKNLPPPNEIVESDDDPRIQEMVDLVQAAGGRALILATSWNALTRLADELQSKVPFKVYRQNDLPKPALIDAFTKEENSCLVATLSFWQGVDIPGRTLSLVILDKIPFPRPDDPLLSARREKFDTNGFMHVDLPKAAALLSQGAGRLIRSEEDRGVVAVLDSRLATKSYRNTLLSSLPPMKRVIDKKEVLKFLRDLNSS